MDLDKILIRQQVIDLTRQFFCDNHYQPTTTPCLVDHPALETTLSAFSVDKFYLATSPESSLKKLISQGLGNCFSISHSFRNLESTSPYHLPEFLMLEWYHLSQTYLDIIKTTENLLLFIFRGLDSQHPNRTNKLLKYLNHTIDLTPPWPQLSLRHLFTQFAHQDLDRLLSDNKFLESDFNQLFLNKIEPFLPTNQPVFITDYPLKFSYFAVPQTNPLYCQRFELYIAGIEIANGNTEDSTKPFPIPPCAGCGLGLDRLAMLLANSPHLNDFKI